MAAEPPAPNLKIDRRRHFPNMCSIMEGIHTAWKMKGIELLGISTRFMQGEMTHKK